MDIIVVVTTWPNHPRRVAYCEQTIRTLQRNLSATGYEIRWLISAESRPADDDDIYLPHWFSATAQALRQAEWSRPGLVLLEHGEGLKECETGGLYHGGWAFRRGAFYRVYGYGPHNNGEDQEIAGRWPRPAYRNVIPASLPRRFTSTALTTPVTTSATWTTRATRHSAARRRQPRQESMSNGPEITPTCRSSATIRSAHTSHTKTTRCRSN